MHPASDAAAVIGTWGTTSRRRLSVLGEATEPGGWAQVQRLGNPLINELIIGTGSKDRFSMDAPSNDAQFANFFLNPLLATVLGSIGVPVPPAPRTDLLPLVQYIAADLPRLHRGPSRPDCRPAAAEHRHSADPGATVEAPRLHRRRLGRISERAPSAATMWSTSRCAWSAAFSSTLRSTALCWATA